MKEMQKARKTTEADVRIGKLIERMRMASKMTQSELGRQLGVSFQQVGKYESGANRLSRTRIEQLAEIFDVPVSTFFDESALTYSGKTEAALRKQDELLEFISTPFGMELNIAFARITHAGTRGVLVRMIKALGDQPA